MSETLINALHLFAAIASVRELSESIAFNDNDIALGDGYESQSLNGSENGLRRWKLTLPTLPNTDLDGNKVVYHDRTISREEYLWNLFSDSKYSGDPFVLQSPRSNQYYLVRFADRTLTYQRMLSKIYSTGIELKQVRKDGVWAFDVAKASSSSYDHFQGGLFSSDTVYLNSGTSALNLTVTGGVATAAAGPNGENIARFNGTTGLLNANSGWNADPCTDIFFVMKIREATFSNAAGILTSSSAGGARPLIGNSGTTKFESFGVSDIEYRKNGILYASGNWQAPMNKWAIVHIRALGGISADQIGKNRTTAATFAKMDIAEILRLGAAPPSVAREIVEYMAVRWKVAG